MKRISIRVITVFALLVGGSAMAAEKWGLPEEKVARFEAKVVDVLAELTGRETDCSGKRQLGLLTDKGELILPLKNVVPFAGATAELTDFCGKRVVADGLFATNRGVRVFVLQFVKEAADGKWRRANRWLAQWAKDNAVDAKSNTAQQWFRNDPRIKALIEKNGITGTKGQ